MINADGLTTDKHGNLMQLQRGKLEGGDSIGWTGQNWFLRFILFGECRKYKDAEFFKKPGGGYVRYPDPNMTNNGFGAYWENYRMGCISRDMFTNFCVGLIAVGRSIRGQETVDEAIKEHGRRFYVQTNNVIRNGQDPYADPTRKWADFTGPDVWALIIRASYKHASMPMIVRCYLCLLDTQMLINVGLLYTIRREETDLVSFTSKLLSSVVIKPTLVSRLTWWIAPKQRLKDAAQIYWDNPDKDKTQRYQPGMVRLTHAAIDKVGNVLRSK